MPRTRAMAAPWSWARRVNAVETASHQLPMSCSEASGVGCAGAGTGTEIVANTVSASSRISALTAEVPRSMPRKHIMR